MTYHNIIKHINYINNNLLRNHKADCPLRAKRKQNNGRGLNKILYLHKKNAKCF